MISMVIQLVNIDGSVHEFHCDLENLLVPVVCYFFLLVNNALIVDF